MLSEVSIANQALGLCGEKPIVSFDDGTDASNLMLYNYANLRDSVLEQIEWSFAIKREGLSKLADGTVLVGNAFQLPLDCIRIVQASPDLQFAHDSNMQWELEDRKVITDEGAVYIRYIARIEDVEVWSPAAVQALVYRIATEIAIPLTKSRTLQQQFYGIYTQRLTDASALDGRQGRTRRIRASWSNKSRYLPSRFL